MKLNQFVEWSQSPEAGHNQCFGSEYHCSIEELKSLNPLKRVIINVSNRAAPENISFQEKSQSPEAGHNQCFEISISTISTSLE